jgi:hypothetical protein
MSVVAVINARTLANGRSGHVVAKTGPSPRNNIPAPYDYNVGAAGASLLRGNGTARPPALILAVSGQPTRLLSAIRTPSRSPRRAIRSLTI